MNLDDCLLDDLDDALASLRNLPRRPGYRRRLLDGLAMPGGPATVRALRAVERAGDERLSVGGVAEMLAVDPSTASRVVDRCVGAELLVRVPDSDDRRRTHLELTYVGRELLDQATRNRRVLLAEVTSEWRAADLEHLLALLKRLRDGFDELEKLVSPIGRKDADDDIMEHR